MSNKARISCEELRQLCVQREWFTAGSNEQYEKLFILVKSGASLDECALTIWLCSNNCTRAEVLEALKESTKGARKCSTCCHWRTANLDNDMYCDNADSERYMEWTGCNEICRCWTSRNIKES